MSSGSTSSSPGWAMTRTREGQARWNRFTEFVLGNIRRPAKGLDNYVNQLLWSAQKETDRGDLLGGTNLNRRSLRHQDDCDIRMAPCIKPCLISHSCAVKVSKFALPCLKIISAWEISEVGITNLLRTCARRSSMARSGFLLPITASRKLRDEPVEELYEVRPTSHVLLFSILKISRKKYCGLKD